MEKEGIIEKSYSEWAAPIVLVEKKDSTLRMCVDYRRLNTVSEMDAYPMPRIDDLIERVGEAKFITTLDLSRGYWQVPVRKEDQPKTAFTTPYGLFQFKVMPFGLQGAPATFQRMTQRPQLYSSLPRRRSHTQPNMGGTSQLHRRHPTTISRPRSNSQA